MDYKMFKVVFDMHWRKNVDLLANMKNLFSKDFTIHKKSGAKGFFEIETDPLRYRQLKRVIMEKLSLKNVTMNEIYESLTYAHLNMELRELENRPISDEMKHKTRYVMDKMEKQIPELRAFGDELACEYWDEATIASPVTYRNMLSPKM